MLCLPMVRFVLISVSLLTIVVLACSVLHGWGRIGACPPWSSPTLSWLLPGLLGTLGCPRATAAGHLTFRRSFALLISFRKHTSNEVTQTPALGVWGRARGRWFYLLWTTGTAARCFSWWLWMGREMHRVRLMSHGLCLMHLMSCMKMCKMLHGGSRLPWLTVNKMTWMHN